MDLLGPEYYNNTVLFQIATEVEQDMTSKLDQILEMISKQKKEEGK
ncbi:MAG: hypothetical protein LBG13_00310 [Holosporales bacterium]|nr:hypothetical protein [Holosporales bacterium]